MSLRDWFAEPRMRGIDVDSEEFLEVHREILASKPMMRGVFREFYDQCISLDDRYFIGRGIRLEIGAGASLFKRYYPEVTATDLTPSPLLDMVVDALAMPFEAGSIHAVYGINCFHHFPSPDRLLFLELERVLAPGGGCVLIEPYYGVLSRWLYPRLFASETYDLQQRSWEPEPGAMGVMRGANQALSHIVFVRDRAVFESRHPRLELVGSRPLRNYPRYVISGGLNFRQLLPTSAIPLLKLGERAVGPLARAFALHHVIVIRKRPHDSSNVSPAGVSVAATTPVEGPSSGG